VWGGFVTLLTFLVVFRVNMANSRYEQATSAVHLMGRDWLNACSSIVALSRRSTIPDFKKLKFQNLMIRLFSILNAVALGEIEIEGEVQIEGEDTDVDRVRAYLLEVIDCASIDNDSMMLLLNTSERADLVFSWIYQCIVESVDDILLNAPPPWISRAFADLEAGMSKFRVAIEMAQV
jgi:hypothetical protein